MSDPFDELRQAGEKMLPRADSVDEVLGFDALQRAYDLVGEGERGDALGMLLHLGSCKRKEEMLEGLGDTTFNMKMKDYLAHVKRLGFKRVLKLPFSYVDTYDKKTYHETFYIYWRADGLLLTTDTYRGDRNSATIYFNFKHNKHISWDGVDGVSGGWNDCSSDVFHEEIALRAYYKYVERGRIDGHDKEDWLQAEQELMYHDDWKSSCFCILVGSIDAREALSHQLDKLQKVGKFLPKWAHQGFLWLLHHGDTHEKQYGEYDYEAIRDERIAMLPKEIQEAIRGDGK